MKIEFDTYSSPIELRSLANFLIERAHAIESEQRQREEALKANPLGGCGYTGGLIGNRTPIPETTPQG